MINLRKALEEYHVYHLRITISITHFIHFILYTFFRSSSIFISMKRATENTPLFLPQNTSLKLEAKTDRCILQYRSPQTKFKIVVKQFVKEIIYEQRCRTGIYTLRKIPLFHLIRPKLSGNCAFPQNFHTRKSGEITVFFLVTTILKMNSFTNIILIF